jgi:hypothetical protein
MSSTTNSLIAYLGYQITIYGGIIVLSLGAIGGLLNIIVFLSLKTFRKNSCAFYLTIMSIVNIGQLFSGLLTRIMSAGFGIDWAAMSLPFCKVRWTIFQFCAIMSYTCLCLATIDQYFATCTRHRWQQWSNIKIAHRLMIICIIICIILMIPYPILVDHVPSRLSNSVVCATTNLIMSYYGNFFMALSLSGYVPDFITVLFGILAYHNVQQLAHRTVPLVRRELDKQLTIMVLVQVVINLFTNVPCVTLNTILFGFNIIQDPILIQKLNFGFIITTILFYSYFAVSRSKHD